MPPLDASGQGSGACGGSTTPRPLQVGRRHRSLFSGQHAPLITHVGGVPECCGTLGGVCLQRLDGFPVTQFHRWSPLP